MKKLLHKLFNLHKWTKTKNKGWDYSEPQERSGDYLPTEWKEYECKCGTKKRVYHDGFTHLGTLPDRVFIFNGERPEYKNLV